MKDAPKIKPRREDLVNEYLLNYVGENDFSKLDQTFEPESGMIIWSIYKAHPIEMKEHVGIFENIPPKGKIKLRPLKDIEKHTELLYIIVKLDADDCLRIEYHIK